LSETRHNSKRQRENRALDSWLSGSAGASGQGRRAGQIGDGTFAAVLPKTALAALTAKSQQVTYGRGSIVLRPGAITRPALLAAGRLRVFLQSPDGRQATLQYVMPGDAVGIAHYFLPDIPLSVQALSEATMLHFEGSVLEDLMGQDGRTAKQVAALLAELIAATTQQTRYLVFGSARQRLAEHLLMLAESDHAGRQVARVGQQDLADAVGSVREHVARLLREFRRLGLVSTSRSSVAILDPAALRAEARLE
jgi:CRP/FNR family cyclic AMP-dependent transcriptional regulator